MWQAVIMGEPCSKANSRKVATFPNRKPLFIKSDKARNYERDALKQIRPPAAPIQDDVCLTATIYYASRRPDLDESLICDVLQKAGVIKNDRLIKEKHIYWALDPANPRAEVRIELVGAQLFIAGARR